MQTESSPPDEPIERRTTGQRAWSFVNSNFGLWLLSGVLLGLIGFAWTGYRDWRHARELRRHQVSKLHTEIRARVERCYRLVQGDWNTPTGVPLERRLQQAGIAGPPRTVVVFPEFKDRPLSSLFWEMRMLGGDNVDWLAAAQGVSEELETGVWSKQEPRATTLPSDDDYYFHLAMLNVLRFERMREIDSARNRLLSQHPPPSKEELEKYIRETWPEYYKLKKEIDARSTAERKRKLEVLQKEVAGARTNS